jgi:hypothetical protein
MCFTTYTATFNGEWAKEQVKTEQDVALAAHTPDKGIITKSPFYKTAGERTFHCTKCNAVTGTEVVPATGVINISVLGDSIRHLRTIPTVLRLSMQTARWQAAVYGSRW